MSKGCQKYSVDLSAYFDGELEGEEAEVLEAHLAKCEGCKESLDRLNSLHSALNSLNRPALGGRSILEDLKNKLHLEGDPSTKRPN